MVKINDEEFNYLVVFLKNNFGINLAKKRVLLEGRLSSYLRINGFNSYSEYIKALKSDSTGKEVANLLNKVTTNHTFFMREAEHFRFLYSRLLPELEKTVRDRDLCVWCAAASTGEEPYTLAMILNDYFGGKVPVWNKRLLASDISLKALAKAQNGVYSESAIAELPDVWKNKYFKEINKGEFQIADKIRNEVIYKQFNLVDNITCKKPYHIIFCRNVMIYFDSPTKDALVERLYNVMAPGGCLFLGLTESISKNSKFVRIQPSVYQKV